MTNPEPEPAPTPETQAENTAEATVAPPQAEASATRAEEGVDPRDARIQELEAALEAERAKAAEVTEKLQRAMADFDNFRKRVRREREEEAQAGREGLLRELLGVVDSFDRALMSEEGSEEALYEGMKLIYKQLQHLLEKSGLERIDAVGHPFDPLLHEAVMMEEAPGYAEGTIIQEFERGYRIQGKTLRAAKVKVAARPKQPPADADEPAEPGDGPAP